MQKHLIVDLVAKVANEDVKVVGGVFFVGAVGLICPIDTDLLSKCQLVDGHLWSDETHSLMDASAIESLHCAFRRSRIVVFNESVIKTLALVNGKLAYAKLQCRLYKLIGWGCLCVEQNRANMVP